MSSWRIGRSGGPLLGAWCSWRSSLLSYLYVHTLVELRGQPGWAAALTPLSVAGMIVSASMTLLARLMCVAALHLDGLLEPLTRQARRSGASVQLDGTVAHSTAGRCPAPRAGRARGSGLAVALTLVERAHEPPSVVSLSRVNVRNGKL